MSQPRVFVSFAGSDRARVRLIFGRLAAQPVDVWNYADEEQEIPGGREISAYLREMIDLSDYFVPIVSPESFTRRYAREEAAHALKRHSAGRLRIVPVVLAGTPEPTDWPEPYRDLAGIRSRYIDTASRASIEAGVAELCKDMDVAFQPLPTEDVRLPFMDRFHAELKEKCPQRGKHENAIYTRLMEILAEFEEAFEGGDFARALERISLFAGMCEYEFPDLRFYYPYIVKAVCEISAGRLDAAIETLQPLQKHPLADENVFGGLGFIYNRQERYREALDCYRRAVQLAPASAGAKAGEVLNAIRCGEAIDVDAVFQAIESGEIRVAEDHVKVRGLKALALAAAERLDEAEAVYAALLADGHVDADTLVNYADTLAAHGKRDQARDLLRPYHDSKLADENLLHRLASLCFQTRRFDEAVGFFALLVRRYPRVRQYRIDAAQAFWRAGRRDEAKRLAASVLDRVLFPLPRSETDFFLDGFANWILARRPRAEHDFERSRMPPADHYRHLIGECD